MYNIFKILNRYTFLIQNDLKFQVINVIEDSLFFEKNNLKNIIVRIFIFVIKNDDHDFIFEILYK